MRKKAFCKRKNADVAATTATAGGGAVAAALRVADVCAKHSVSIHFDLFIHLFLLRGSTRLVGMVYGYMASSIAVAVHHTDNAPYGV